MEIMELSRLNKPLFMCFKRKQQKNKKSRKKELTKKNESDILNGHSRKRGCKKGISKKGQHKNK